jgi:hypothetical protein
MLAFYVALERGQALDCRNNGIHEGPAKLGDHASEPRISKSLLHHVFNGDRIAPIAHAP